MIGNHPDYVSSLVRAGKLKGERVGRNWLTTEDSVKNYINLNRLSAKPISPHKVFLSIVAIVVVVIFIGVTITSLISNARSQNENKVSGDPLGVDATGGYQFSGQSPNYQLYEPIKSQ